MKKIYLFVLVLMANVSFAQDVRLFENTWKLDYLIKDNQLNYPPENSEVQEVTLTFDQDFFSMETTVFNYLSATTSFGTATENNVSLSNHLISLLLPNLPQTLNFESLYFDFFTENPILNSFQYNILQNNNGLSLTITSLTNAVAVYQNQPLKTKIFGKNQFSVYPNPAQTTIALKFSDATVFKNTVVKIFSSTGNIVKTEILQSNLQEINIEDLAAGLYFIYVNENEKTLVQKFVKL